MANPNPFTNNGSTLIYYNGAYQIGIGTNLVNSTYKLNINGDVNFTGSLYKSGTAYDLTTFITSTTAGNTYQPKITSTTTGTQITSRVGALIIV